MLQDKYGRLIIIGVFVIIGVVLLLAPGLNSKKNALDNEQLNFTSMPKDEINKTDDNNLAESASVSETQTLSDLSAEDKMLDAWGMRKTQKAPEQNQQIIPSENIDTNITAEDRQSKADEFAKNIEEAKAKQVSPVEQPQQPKSESNKNVIKVNGKCFAPPKVAASLSKSECLNSFRSLGIKSCPTDDSMQDSWGGAVKACGGLQKMPDMDDLLAISRIIYGKDNIRVSQSDMDKHRAYGKNVINKNATCDTFAFGGLTYNSTVAQGLGFPENGGIEIWGRIEVNPKSSISLIYGDTSATYKVCSERNVQSTYSLCQVECN